jgi:hypothetical protein
VKYRNFYWLGVCLFAQALAGQSWEVATRAEEHAQAVRDKQAVLKPEEESRFEDTVRKINEGVIDSLFTDQAGFGLKFGGLTAGSGFAIGPRYRRNDLAGERVQFQASLVGSMRRFYAAEVRLRLPRIAGSRFSFELGGRHSDAPSISYFGPGAGSRRSGRTSFRREDTELRASFGWRPDRRRWLIGYEAAALMINIGPGKDSRFLSSEQVYTPRQAPGIDVQSNFLLGGPFIQYDHRNRPGLPTRGGNYMVQWLQHWDRSLGAHSFQRAVFSAERYIPFFNEKRVIALRARTDLSFVSSDKSVPFYLQPTLGGPDTVRGFERFRYQANNATVLNAEYRWEVAPTLDMAAFVDAGNVFDRPGLIGFRDMKSAAGLGFRVKTRDAVVLRADGAASREGFRLWITFSNIF